MAGDWIKMRDNLWDDPRVAKIVDLTDSSEAAVIGSLYWLWATADQHTEDGVMAGLTLRAIDRKTGVKGFAEALCVIGWLIDHPDGVQIVDFERHNGQSAKKRCQTAKRVAVHAVNAIAANAVQTQDSPQKTEVIESTNAQCVSSALAREREEKRREEEKTGGERERESAPMPPAESASPHPPQTFSAENRGFIATERPDLDGPTVWLNFCDHYPTEKCTSANWRKWVRREMRGPVAGVDLAPAAATSDPDSKASVEAVALARGMGRWDSLKEPWQTYKTRVKNASNEVTQ